MKLRTSLHLAPRAGKALHAILAMRNQEIFSSRDHLRLCGDWLLGAQEALDSGGYAASYSLITGLHPAYIETTGYIIPTMLSLATVLSNPRYRESALRAGEWILSVQAKDGYFTGVDGDHPQVFDTGQVLMGLDTLYRETLDTRFLNAAFRAADWLVTTQDEDGSWTTMGYYRGIPATYHTRVGAALLRLAAISGVEKYHASGAKNLRWAAGRQQPNGFFLNSELSPGADPVLHTMVYVLEGFLIGYEALQEPQWLDALLRGAEPLKRVNLERDLVLRSQYDSSFSVTNREKCVPGLAQWAWVCLHLHQITKDVGYLEAAQLSIYYLKSKQLRGKGILRGALPASVPLWGYYHPMLFPSWAVKYFADALLEYEKHTFAVWQEQEVWAGACLGLQLDGGSWERQSESLEPIDTIVLRGIHTFFASNGNTQKRVLDIGCGTGRYMRHLREQRPTWTIDGIDPAYDDHRAGIFRGSAHTISFPDETFDAAYSHGVMLHVGDLPRALGEAWRVLKAGGLLVISDRNPVSARGVLKPWHELRGRWIYPWDSPFRERWLTARQWRRILAQTGFEVAQIQVINNPGDRGIRRAIPTNRFLLIKARKSLHRSDGRYEQSYPASRFRLARSWLHTVNRAASVANLRIDTLTADRAEVARLQAVDARQGFVAPIYPIPPNFAESEHQAILDALPSFQKRFASFQDASKNDVGFQFDNAYFRSPDAEVLYAMVRTRRPRNILEVGCGHSTRIIRQALKDDGAKCQLTCIDPCPRVDVLSLADVIIREPIETQDAAQLAKTLNAGDFLFIDTSHEIKVANDVAFIYANLLPRIRSGVVVHIHDILLPYDYPKEWVFDWHCNNWGEQYIVQTLLWYGSWKVLWPGYYLQKTMQDFSRHFPHCRGDGMAQSLWLQKW